MPMGIYLFASGTIFDISAQVADFLFLNKCLFSPILRILKLAIFDDLSDFLFLTISNCKVHLIYFGLLFLSQSFQ